MGLMMDSNAHSSAISSLPTGRIVRLAGLSFFTGFTGAMMPGPLLTVTIEQTLSRGWDAFFWLITGHALLELVLVVLMILGLRAVLARPRVLASVGLVGGAALLYMGVDMMRHAMDLSLSVDAGEQTGFGIVKLMILGAAVCAANPYFTGWWATIGAGQMAQMAPRTGGEYLAFYLGHEAADYTWYGAVAAMLVFSKSFMSDGVYRGLILVCGALVIFLSLMFLFRGAMLMWRPERAKVRDMKAEMAEHKFPEVCEQIYQAFKDVPYPGDKNLRVPDRFNQPYQPEDESSLLEKEFKGKRNQWVLEAEFLDQSPDGFGSSLSFFSDAAFHFYIPAYMIADLDGLLMHQEPSWSLSYGLDVHCDKIINPRNPNSQTWGEYEKERFERFSAKQAKAVLAYLNTIRETQEAYYDPSIDEAIDYYWYEKAHGKNKNLKN